MSGLDRFRNREPKNIIQARFDSEELVATLYDKYSTDEIRILLVGIKGASLACIRTVKRDGTSWVVSRSISLMKNQIEGILDGLDKASIQYASMAGAKEGDLPKLPTICGESGDILVKLDRHNSYYNIKITRKFGNDWAMIKPDKIEEMIEALIQVHDRIDGPSAEEPNESEITF